VASGKAGPPLIMLAESRLAQPKVPLISPPAVGLPMNSSSAAIWPRRIDSLSSKKFCCNQAVNSRVVASASILLGSAMLPVLSTASRLVLRN